jgi:hypothetical protein
MRALVIVLLIMLSSTLEASDYQIRIEIEKKAAELSNCSKERPCLVSVSGKNGEYHAKVRASASVTSYGVLKFLTGSVTFYIFDKNGKLRETKRTT